MRVSIIIPTYNEERFIVKCLESLLKQVYKDYEIIMVDDGSEDKTWEVLKGFKAKYKKIQIYKQLHFGPARARNFGVKKSQGEILVFVDADMYFANDFLVNLIKPILEKKSKGTYSTEEYVANWNNVWARCWNYNWNLPDKKRIKVNNNQNKDFRAILKIEFNKVKGFSNSGYTDTWSLSEKLGYKPTSTKAKYYHYNPATISEIFKQAKWVVKRQYKFGIIGYMLVLIRHNIIFSLLNGVKKAIIKKEPGFLIFKVVYDFAAIVGLFEYRILEKKY
jgi:poly-beta-1,6-N-acetyl-D-glucosamine synthase